MTALDDQAQSYDEKQREVSNLIRETAGEEGFKEIGNRYELRLPLRKLLNSELPTEKKAEEAKKLIIASVSYLQPTSIKINEATVKEALPLERVQEIYGKTHHGFDAGHPSADYYHLLNVVSVQLRHQMVIPETLQKLGLEETDIAKVSEAAELFTPAKAHEIVSPIIEQDVKDRKEAEKTGGFASRVPKPAETFTLGASTLGGGAVLG